MNVFHSKDGLKKWLSSFLIFVIFAGQIFQIPLTVERTYAAGSDAPNLVSVIVSKSTNSGEVKDKVKRYAEDIQSALTNTRVIIVEVADNIAPHSIAALNEKLYYEGDGNGISRLVGTVLIGKLPLPVVHNGNKSFLSIYPYTDFDEKVFIFDTTKGYYEISGSPVEQDRPEIWHGVIQPNSGNSAQDRQKLIAYLDKTHDFYQKQGVFANMSQTPRVFYLDVLHDQKAASASNWKSYNLGMEYLEDLSYNRFNKHLAKTLYEKFQGFQDATEEINPAELAELGIVVPKMETMNFESSPDIQTRTAILKVTKQFFEIFNEKYIGDILKLVYNTGRYGDGANTRADIAPVLISKRDEFMKRVIKDSNTAIENSIDSLVQNGLASNIAIPVDFKISGSGFLGSNAITTETPSTYQNYYFGKQASSITKAQECSIVRGSSLPVEANRGYNIMNTDSDIKNLTQNATLCFPGGKPATSDWWGGNSPLNMKATDLSAEEMGKLQNATNPADFESVKDRLNGKFQLQNNRYTNYVLPTYDLLGQNELRPGSPLKTNSPADCFAENFIADPFNRIFYDEYLSYEYYHPKASNGTQFTCVMQDSYGALGHKTYANPDTNRFANAINNRITPPACTIVKVNLLGGGISKEFGGLCNDDGSGTATYGTVQEYNYKKIPSWIQHKSPTDEEYGAALKGMTTPSLASDRDRYIDFIVPKGTVVKIEYPNFFRLNGKTLASAGISNLNTSEIASSTSENPFFTEPSSISDTSFSKIENTSTDTNSNLSSGVSANRASSETTVNNSNLLAGNQPDLTIEIVKDRIKSMLDAKSNEINAIIAAHNPATLPADQKAVYQALNSGSYPTQNVDLYKMVNESGNMLTTLADTILWYNKSNATSKYSFILENYLDRDGNRDYPLSGHYSDYEMGYIGGPGDALNMYVKVDPESKGRLPSEITDIQQRYQSLFNTLDAANIGQYNPEDSKFKCGPPEGVPIWKWLPAVFCWIGTILPPTVTAGSCGPALSTDKENDKNYFMSISTGADGKADWQTDRNKNGILDGYEWIGTGDLKLSTPLKRIGYRTGAPLTAMLTKDSKLLAHDSFNKVFFDVKKVVLKSGQPQIDGVITNSDKNVYLRGASGELGSVDTLKKYVFFTPMEVRAEAGTAKYEIQSGDRDIDVYLDATVSPKDKNNTVAFRKVSNELLLEVRSEALKINTIVQSGTASKVDPTFRAGEADKIRFEFSITGKNTELPVPAKAPLEFTIIDDIDGTVLQNSQKINGADFVYTGELLKKAGNYRFEFIDANNRFGTVFVNVLPADPVRIDAIASSSLFVKGQKNTILVRAIDSFGNLTKGNLLQINASISGGGFFTENNNVTATKSTVEGMMSFEISANDGGQTHTIQFSTTDSKGNSIKKEVPLTVKSIDYAKIRVGIPNRENIVAGGTGQTVNLEIVDANGGVLDGFNGVASIDFPKNSGSFDTQFVQIQNGKNTTPIKFNPGSVAIQGGKIDVQVPGIKDIEGGTLTVLPNLPMRVGLSTDTNNLEAKIGNSAGITAKLFDRYGNLAFNHPGGLLANFKIPSGYEKYGYLSASTISFTNGVAETRINATSNPGTLYFTVEVTPGLEKNAFTISDESGASLVIQGYSKNVAFLESSYLWNAEKLKKTNYNVLSTTLLGADYGNVTVPNYLAGELIFNPGSSSMAVTTLLNNAEQKSEIVQMTPGGKLVKNQANTVEIEVGSNNNRTTLDIFDPFKRENIGRLYLNTRPDTPMFNCGTSDLDALSACKIDNADSYFVLKGLGAANVTKNSNGLSLSFDGVPVFEITPDGTIKKYPTIKIEADGTETKNLLSLSLLSEGTKIGRLGIKWNASQILIASPSSLESILSNNPGTIVYEGISPRYALEQSYIGNSSYGAQGIKIFSQREESQIDRSFIGASNKLGFEEYTKVSGIGFGDGNTTQLEIASQASVGEATKWYATYSSIVIGDPVVRLPELLSSQNYDRTLGKKLINSAGGIIESYATLDYNADGMEDIVVFYQDGKVELLQNYKGVYRNLGYLLYVVDAGRERKGAGDFNGDGFGDVVMVDQKGKLIIIENRNGKFVRISPKITGSTGSDETIAGAIRQLEIFDMDRDGNMDLVISDDSGELNILYGGKAVSSNPSGNSTNSETGNSLLNNITSAITQSLSGNTKDADVNTAGSGGSMSSGIVFTKKTLDQNIGLKIGSGSITTEGAIRFDGIKEITANTQTNYSNETANSEMNSDGELLSLADQIRLLDSKIYYQQTVRRLVAGQNIAQATRMLGAVGDDPENPGVPNKALADEIALAITDTQSLSASGSVDIDALTNTSIEERKTFLRSEFADGKNIEIAKKYRDINGGFIQAGDPIEVTINIKNLGTLPLTNVSYLDRYEKNIFQSSTQNRYTVYKNVPNGAVKENIIGSGSLVELTEGEFDYQFNQLSIPSNESISITYELKANAVAVGKFHVGILETDDIYGDVSMKANAICGEQEILWKTVAPTPRSYLRTLKDVKKAGDVTGAQKGKFTDYNNNGSPDYIDLLQGAGDDNHIESSLWDPSKYGILVFREISGANGLDGTNFEIGRVVANATTGYIQLNPVGGSEDIPVMASSSLSKSVLDEKTLKTGSIDDPQIPSCGAPGTITTDLELVGFEQSYHPEDTTDIRANLKFYATGKSNTVNASGSIVSTENCKIRIDSNSNPTWNGSTVTDLGWKILTKSTFRHFSFGGTQSNIINTDLGIPDSHEPQGSSLFKFSNNGSLFGGTIDIGGMSNDNIEKVNGALDTLVQGLGCGFGGGSCLSLPLNWAPLAPGSAPVVMGHPIGGLSPSTGYPVFSLLTGVQRKCGKFPCCIPTVFPASQRAYIPGPFCGSSSAGGSLGTWAPTNTFRFYITPTITGAVGVAACFGGTSAVSGRVPPQGVSPLVPGGNCIVAAKPLLGCKDDGSDGNFQDLGSSDNGTINAGSCKNKDSTATLSESDRALIKSYVSGNSSFAKDIIANANGRGTFQLPRSPLLTMGLGGGAGGYEININASDIKNFDIGKIEKIKNERVSAFPDFIMDWVNRQLEEVANKLTSLPTLYIIKPDFRGAIDTGWSGFTDKLEQNYATGKQNGSPVLGNENVGRSISGVKSAYEFMSRLPLIRFEKTTLDITYPDIGREDLEKGLTELKNTKSQWEKEIASKKALYEKTATKEGLDSSVIVRAEGLVGSIDQNIRTVEEYKKFPEKLSKYLTWKERYATQLLCNITAIQGVLDGFITRNAIRFKAWIEFYELIKNILKGWQLIPSLFYAHEAECGVCRNERHDAKHFMFKLIKAVIPPFPIIKFPKWPDIILDLHNVRLGIRIAMPEFVFRPTPIVLPKFPRLGLPGTPTLGIGLPSIPTLPNLPPLPNLPDIPTLPVINLPELPPPPTIPKLFGTIKFTLNILKIVAKVLCIMRTNPFVPEWRAGDQIAQITERQGKLKIDFLNIEFPQFNASFVDAIKVTTFVNFEFQVEFLLEMAKATFEPINSFSSNLSNLIPNATQGIIPGDINLKNLNPGNKEIDIAKPTGFQSDHQFIQPYAQALAKAFVTTISQGQKFANERAAYQDVRDYLMNELAHVHAAPGTPGFAILEEMREGLRVRGDAESQELARTLRAENNEKFELAHRFVKSEIHETTELQAELGLVQTGDMELSEIFEQRANTGNANLADTGNTPYSTETPLPDFTKYNERAFQAYSEMTAPRAPSELDKMGENLKNSMNAYTAEVEKNSIEIAANETTAGNGNLTDYEYRGIYTMDNQRQIRLFDYTDELVGNERAIPVNRIGNGALEYIYQSGNGVYLKTRLGNSVPRPASGSIPTFTPSDLIDLPSGESLRPTAPNHFMERFAASGEINFKFRPADTESDTIFRMEFYDYIDRFDRRMSGQRWSEITPTTRVSYVDLVPELVNETVTDTSITGLVLQKPYATYQRGLGNGTIVGPGYRTLGTGNTIQIAGNKSIYADGGGARIRYQIPDTQSVSSGSFISIPNSRELKFLTTMNIEVISGNIILVEDIPNLTPRPIDLRELSGMPVLVDQKVEVSVAGARLDIAYYNNANLTMNGPAFYESHDLGTKSDEYDVALRQDNSWYYAQLVSVSPSARTNSRITLLSPQSQADKESPLIQISGGFRAPVYIEQAIDLRDKISDVSGITDVFIDTDLSVDTDNDGRKDNDRDSESPTSILRQGASNLEWFIKAQNRLFEKEMKIWASDSNGNLEGKETKLTIYAPVPNISGQSGTLIQGNLNETLTGEPVSIVRFRNGKLKVIGEDAPTKNDGGFNATFNTSSGGLVVRGPNGTEIAKINEKTGKLTLNGGDYTIGVVGANADAPTRIQILQSGQVVYSQSVALGSAGKIESVDNLNDALIKAAGGLGVKLPDQGWNLVKNPSTSPVLPGGVFITNPEKVAVYGIAKDGNIYLLEPNLKLEYRTERDYFVIDVRSGNGDLVGTLYYVLDSEYVIK